MNYKNSDDEIRKFLKEIGVNAASNWKRDTLIHKCEENGAWLQIKPSVVPDSYKERYGTDQNCGDDVASMLRGMDIYEVGKDNGIDVEDKWGEGRTGKTDPKIGVPMKPLNPGMRRMNLSVVLRGRVRRGEFVVIGDHTWNDEAKEEVA